MKRPRVIFKAIPNGWAIELGDGRKVASFTGPEAKRRALRYLAAHAAAANLELSDDDITTIEGGS